MAKTLLEIQTQVRQLIGDYQQTTFSEAAVTEAINFAQDLVIRHKGFKIGKRVYPVIQYPTGQFPADLLAVKRVQIIESVGPIEPTPPPAVFAVVLDAVAAADIRVELAANQTGILDYVMTPGFTDASYYLGRAQNAEYAFIAVPSTSTVTLELFGDALKDSRIPMDDNQGSWTWHSSQDGSTTKTYFTLDALTVPGDIALLAPGESGYKLTVTDRVALGASFGINNSVGVYVGPVLNVKVVGAVGGISYVPMQCNLYIAGVG